MLVDSGVDGAEEFRGEMRVRRDELGDEVRFACTEDDLVVDIGDVHDKVDVVAKVVLQDAADDILGQVVTTTSAFTMFTFTLLRSCAQLRT